VEGGRRGEGRVRREGSLNVNRAASCLKPALALAGGAYGAHQTPSAQLRREYPFPHPTPSAPPMCYS